MDVATATGTYPATTGPSRTIWFNGRLYGGDETPSVPVTDHGLVVGDGVFEALKITAAGPFAVQRHLDRMSRSAKALELPPPDQAVVRGAIEAVCADYAWEFGKIRITYTGGVGPLGSQAAYGPPTLVVIAEPTDPPAPAVDVVTAPWRRNENGALTGVKSTSYAENVRGLAYAHARDAAETIFLNTAGDVCEGTGTNIFCAFGSRVVTPPLAAGCLAGITRAVLLEWCDIVEEDFTLSEAAEADEVFITSSLRDVQAVGRWDGAEYAAPGPRTAEIAAQFMACSTELVDP
jgi:branched-chain amino acid aminotransferase